jgi:transcriptional regulator with XRE-family HTH domain
LKDDAMAAKRRRRNSKAAAARKTAAPAHRQAATHRRRAEARSLVSLVAELAAELTSGALRLAADTAGIPLKMAGTLFLEPPQLRLLTPQQRRMMRETGLYLRDVREVAGLTLAELGDALDLKDHSLLEAAERGTATLSFELVLRLAALLARHDPIPFIFRFVRTYNPELWKALESWGIGRLPAHFERERQFLNVYRRHDAARKLSEPGFGKVLAFTSAAFEMALQFAAEHEGLPLATPQPVP